ncbi:hypothetical protein BX600DRAFT_267454 [Xylariales sp. PMI_506]|nr:hypothetical protein BX600DRAFT_267454 [Xylariales sp. PMI_506]
MSAYHRQQRTKTFTGCWTCRSRRVKCDEQTPSCRRCQQYGVQCEGYGVRLSWLVNVGEDPARLNSDDGDEDSIVTQSATARSRPSRRALTNVGAWLSSPHLSSSEIDSMLERIDNCPSGRSQTEKGIFSVFPSLATPPTTASRVVTPRSQDFEDGDHDALDENSTIVATTQPRESFTYTTHQGTTGAQVVTTPSLASVLHQINNGVNDKLVHEPNGSPSRLDYNSLPPLGGEYNDAFDASRAQESANNTIGHIGRPDIVASSPLTPILPRPIVENSLQPPPRHLDLLQMPAAQKRLIHHWVTFTSVKLVLIDEPHNPCRTMMLPMALRGLMSPAEHSTADIATFHAICACAAYNLYELGGRGASSAASDRALALRHDQQAIRHLRHNLAQAAGNDGDSDGDTGHGYNRHHRDPDRDQSFAMAIMACITIEAISGNTGRWRAHVAGGLAYLGKLWATRAGPTANDPGLSAFQAHMVSMAILCGCDVPAELKSFLHGRSNLELSFPYYGASSLFLRNQDRMNTLATASTATTFGSGSDQTATPSAAAASGGGRNKITDGDLDSLELELYLNFPAPIMPRLGVPPLQPAHAAMLHHMAQAFYYASLVFFQRSVRRVPLLLGSSVQTLVASGVRHLESIEEVAAAAAVGFSQPSAPSASSGYSPNRENGGGAGSVMMWPALVLAAECGMPDLQSRMRAWFRAKRQLGFRNVVVLEELASTIWERRAGSAASQRGCGEQLNNSDDVRWQDIIVQDQFDVFRL